MFAKALGAEVTAVTRSTKKRAVRKRCGFFCDNYHSLLGATQIIDSAEKILPKITPRNLILLLVLRMPVRKSSQWTIISRILLLESYLIHRMLNINGTFNQCGLPNENLPPISRFTFASVLPCQTYLTS